MVPLALYVHVPFCARRCSYCHFEIKVLHPRSDAHEIHHRYVTALEQEVALRAPAFGDRPVGSVFFGGGTPSRLSLLHLKRLITSIRSQFRLAADAEWSIEVNPEDVAPGYLQGLLELGFNRLSVGVQTFDDPGLTAMHRLHDGARAIDVLRNCPTFPFGVSLDLILGVPFQTRATLERDLDLIGELAPQHVSLYMMERDLPTPLDKMEARLALPDEDLQADFYELVQTRLDEMGFVHYEISNFAQPGFGCHHNRVYWLCGDYLGFGPAAHGRVGLHYRVNEERLTPWLEALEAGQDGQRTLTTWTPERLRQERIIQGLRLSEGVPLSLLQPEELEELEGPLANGLVVKREGRLALSPRGRLLGNEVFELFVEDL